jgi:hypothetical protein
VVQRRNGEGQRRAQGCAAGEIVPTGAGTIPKPANRGNDVIGVHRRLPAALHDRLLDHFHRVFRQQLQDPHVLPRAGGESLALFEVGPQLIEAGRQLPTGKHEGMVQGGRPATEDSQVVLGLHDPFATGVTAGMTGNHAGPGHHLDPIDIGLDRHGLESPASRNTVAVRIEPHRLVFVHLPGLGNQPFQGGRIQANRMK